MRILFQRAFAEEISFQTEAEEIFMRTKRAEEVNGTLSGVRLIIRSEVD